MILKKFSCLVSLTKRSTLVVDDDEVVDDFRLLPQITNGECVSGYL